MTHLSTAMVVWAPCLRYHEGTFYIYWGDPDRGIYMVKTQDPAGEWSVPVTGQESLWQY